MPPAGVSPGGETMRHVVVHTIARCVRLLHERTILVLLLLFCLGMGCMLWDVSRLQSNLIDLHRLARCRPVCPGPD